MEELGNPFEEESTDVLILDSKEIADPAAVETIRNVQRLGREQLQAFIKECLVDRSKSIHDVIHRNKLKLFKNMAKTNASKGKKQLTSLKSDAGDFTLGARLEMEIWKNFFVMKIKHILQRCLIVVISI